MPSYYDDLNNLQLPPNQVDFASMNTDTYSHSNNDKESLKCCMDEPFNEKRTDKMEDSEWENLYSENFLNHNPKQVKIGPEH